MARTFDHRLGSWYGKPGPARDRSDMLPNIAKKDWYEGRPPSRYRFVSCNYSIHLMNPRRPKGPLAIPRILGTDIEGTIEIGQTTNLAQRIRQIRSAALGNIGHGDWALFHHVYKISAPLRKLYGSNEDLVRCLRLSYIKTKASLLVEKEIQAFNDYITRYGELPPTNCQLSGSKKRSTR